MMQFRGSQVRENIDEAGYKIICKVDDGYYLQEVITGKAELWIENDHYAGYVVVIDGKGHEFVRTIDLQAARCTAHFAALAEKQKLMLGAEVVKLIDDAAQVDHLMDEF